MNLSLRSELVHYGELAQACYDAFVYDPFFCFYGSCKYNRREFFASLGMKGVGYEVTHYLQHQLAQLLHPFVGAHQDLEREGQPDRLRCGAEGAGDTVRRVTAGAGDEAGGGAPLELQPRRGGGGAGPQALTIPQGHRRPLLL